MLFVIFSVTFLYFILIAVFIFGFENVKIFNGKSSVKKNEFSILIPFRNEAKNLPNLLHSLSELNYPKHVFEIILIDDASKDNSVELITNFKVHNRKLNISIITNQRISNSPKKDAITLAISVAKYDWIITTDADCIVPKKWLQILDAFIQDKKPKMVVCPVTYSVSNTIFQNFQLLDFLSLQSATISGFGIHKPFLCNGANLAYQKELFNRVKGFMGNDNIASGDDIFLMEKALKNFPKQVLYLKSRDALVFTKPQDTINDLIQQRIRWAAKTSSYTNVFGKLVGFLVLAMNAVVISSILLTITQSLNISVIILIFALKLALDFLLIRKSIRFFNQNIGFIYYIISAFLYPFFSVFIAVYSLFFGYKWKDRKFKK